MRKAILLFICCLPAFADSAISTELTGVFQGNADAVGCSGAASCQASFYQQFRDPNNSFGLYEQSGSISATAWGRLNTDPWAYLEVAQSRNVIYVPVGSYLLGASLETNDASHPGPGVPYLSPFAIATVTFNIPESSGDVQMRVFVNSFSTEGYGSGNLSITTPAGAYRVPLSCPQYGCQAAGPEHAPEFDMTLLHTPGTTGAITFYAYSGTTFQETNADQFDAIVTPTPEPATFALVGLLLAPLLLLATRNARHDAAGERDNA